MTVHEWTQRIRSACFAEDARDRWRTRLIEFPWWLGGMVAIAVLVILLITTQPDFRQAFTIIRAGLGITLLTTVGWGVSQIILSTGI
jgi:cell division protein FtsW (lipid II flippase)